MKTIRVEKVETWLPVFSGFYGTIWESNQYEEMEMECINEKRSEKGLPDVSWDDIEWDYQAYFEYASKGITEYVGDRLISLGMIEKYKYQKLSSPREYNFVNDSIHVGFALDVKNRRTIDAYLRENVVAFTKYLKDRYTSYDGFSSGYSNNVCDWLVDPHSTLTHTHKLGSVLDFILRNEDPDLETEAYEYWSGNGLTLSAKNYDALIGPDKIESRGA